MANFKKDILQALADNKETPADIVAILIEGSVNSYKPLGDRELKAAPIANKLINWEKAAPALDYEYDSGYGGQDCHNIYIWTVENVYYVHEYDGATWLEFISRNPREAQGD